MYWAHLSMYLGLLVTKKKGKQIAWTLIRNQIKVRELLKKQGLDDSDTCPFGCNDQETAAHLTLKCIRMKHIWGLMGIRLDDVKEWAGIFNTGDKLLCETKTVNHILSGPFGLQGIERSLMTLIYLQS